MNWMSKKAFAPSYNRELDLLMNITFFHQFFCQSDMNKPLLLSVKHTSKATTSRRKINLAPRLDIASINH